tara:strand:+ start:347 stop:1297 length:951 start_codon:yes stop_codon:yes gene_type:complete
MKKLTSKIKLGNKTLRIVPKKLILKPNKQISWMSSHVGAAYMEVVEKKNLLAKIYISGRGKDNKSRIGVAIISFKEREPKIIKIFKQPLLDIPKLKGFFDTDGVLYPEILDINKNKYLYYCGWTNLKSFNYNCNIGLAREYKKKFRRISNAPVFGLNDTDPIGTASFSILRDKNNYTMYYTSFDPWKKIKSKVVHNYYIKIAKSKDGLKWTRKNQIAIPLKGKEIAVAKPSVFKLNNFICMFFSARETNYGIYFAYSKNGKKFKRLKNKIKLKQGKWSSNSQCYPAYVDFGEKKFLLYCGNSYGKTGIGYAEIIYS